MKQVILLSMCFFSSVAAYTTTSGTCDEYSKNEDQCMKSTENGESCAFCSSAAVGTLCAPESDAKGLPSSVFKCEYQAAAVENKVIYLIIF